MNTPYVPSQAQLLAALQMILDNRRHAQETIRFQKARVFFFVVFAFLATLQAKAMCPVVQAKSDSQIAVYFAFQLLPVGIILSIPLAFLPHALHFPGVSDRSSAWRLGLAKGESAALLAAIQVESDALRKELASIDLHAITGFITCAVCVAQLVASGLVILIG